MHIIETRSVAVIGGGFCGTMVAAQLLDRAKGPLEISLIERTPGAGRGPAFGAQDPALLLNVPASQMSAYPQAPGHFLAWMRARETTTPDAFVPRVLYGAYLDDVLDEAEARAQAGVTLDRVEDEAVALTLSGAGARLRLRSGRSLEVQRVVLALGNHQPRRPAALSGGGAPLARYIGDPWSTAVRTIGPDEGVLLIGSGLTMADVVSSLSAAGHRGAIHVVSRRGLLPQPHRAVEVFPPFLEPGEAPRSVRALVRLVRLETEKAQRAGRDWRSVMDSLRPATQGLWRGLATAEKARFLRHVRPYWDSHRHRVPREVFAVVEGQRLSGRLRVHAARVLGMREEAGRLTVSLRPRASAGTLDLTVDRVVNCTGPECDLSRTQEPLLRDLFEQGVIRPDAVALGLDADEEGAVLNRCGEVSERISTLGPALRGVLWETIAVPELRAQAAGLGERLRTTAVHPRV